MIVQRDDEKNMTSKDIERFDEDLDRTFNDMEYWNQCHMSIWRINEEEILRFDHLPDEKCDKSCTH